MRVIAHEDSRYANTLIVSLNNRIYFREHELSRSVVNSADNHLGSQHGLDGTSRHFHQVQVGAPTRAAMIGDDFKLNGMSHTVELARMKEDVVSFNSE